MQVYTEVPVPDEQRHLKSSLAPSQFNIASLASEEEYLSCHATLAAPSTATSVSASRQASNQPSPRQQLSPTDTDYPASSAAFSEVAAGGIENIHISLQTGTKNGEVTVDHQKTVTASAVRYKLPQHKRNDSQIHGVS